MKKMICVLIMTQISTACTATTGYEPTKPSKKKSQPEMSLMVPSESCVHRFSRDQSLKEIAETSGLMSRDCKLSLQQIADLAEGAFALKK